jgi:hypothetical protein
MIFKISIFDEKLAFQAQNKDIRALKIIITLKLRVNKGDCSLELQRPILDSLFLAIQNFLNEKLEKSINQRKMTTKMVVNALLFSLFPDAHVHPNQFTP